MREPRDAPSRHSRQPPTVIPADAGTQCHKNNRLPRAPRPPRSASAGSACFAFLWVPASAGMTWLRAGTQGHKNNRLPPRPSATPVRFRGSGVFCFSRGFPRTREPRAIKTTVYPATPTSIPASLTSFPRHAGTQCHKTTLGYPAPLGHPGPYSAVAACFDFSLGSRAPPPVIPAGAGTQCHKNNRLPPRPLTTPARFRGSGVLYFSLGSASAGTT